MLIPLAELVDRGLAKPGPVLHVGAHLGEEAPVYHELGFSPVTWIEANPFLMSQLWERISWYPDQKAINALCSATQECRTFHFANNGQSSSMLELGTHKTEHPEVFYEREAQMQTTTVDDLFEAGLIPRASLMNLDVQGAELEVLKGSFSYIPGVQTIYAEVNRSELYKGGALLPELQEWLAIYDFEMVDVVWTRHGWGDGVFCRI